MNNQKHLTKSTVRNLLLFCCFVGVAIYGMSTANLTIGLFLVAVGCLLHTLEKGRIDIEDVSTSEKRFPIRGISKRSGMCVRANAHMHLL